MYVDAHCHLSDSRFQEHLDGVVNRAREAGIVFYMQGGVDEKEWRRQQLLRIPGLIKCFGLHPWAVDGADRDTCGQALVYLEQILPQAVALGETGLDKGPRMNPERFFLQEKMFRRQLQMAKEHRMPLVLHVVRAHGSVLNILREEGSSWSGMVHGFTATYEVARSYIDMGLAVSVGGAAGRKGYKKLKNALPRIPADQLLVESDAPDMAPDDFGRSLNEPSSIWIVARHIGQLTDRQPEEILAASRDNLARIFSLELDR
ncbi:MAG: TatD family hydrolase [Acidobacteriota bacterium]|nr:TatD family hydrolase [Acidobacteriota bacterium]